MARNLITDPKKLAHYSALIGREVVTAWTRGGTDHRVDAGLPDGSIVRIYKDGTFEDDPFIRWEPDRRRK